MRILAAMALFWAVGALLSQVLRARGGGRREYGVRAGDPLRGVIYAFTGAMLPSRKESIRHHPGKFAVGLLLHLGVLASLVQAILLVAGASLAAETALPCGLLALIALPAGLFLWLRRVRAPVLRAMSAPDDFLAILAVCGLLVMTALFGLGAAGPDALLLYAALFLLYLPLGKLRHAVFFFVARADHGRRLGYRGTFPPLARTHGD